MTRAWFGLFGAAGAWSVQTLVDYGLVAHFCYPGRAPLDAPGFGGTRAVALAVSAVTLALAVAALFAARRDWAAARPAPGGPSPANVDRRRFVALSGLLVSTVFLFAIAMNALPLLTAPLCAGAT